MAPKPVLRCLAARQVEDGSLSRTRLVSLGEAYLLFQAGWFIVGPDPEDEQALAAWEREQQTPLNTPRWKWWPVRRAKRKEA